jgi:hypothetical protein
VVKDLYALLRDQTFYVEDNVPPFNNPYDDSDDISEEEESEEDDNESDSCSDNSVCIDNCSDTVVDEITEYDVLGNEDVFTLWEDTHHAAKYISIFKDAKERQDSSNSFMDHVMRRYCEEED